MTLEERFDSLEVEIVALRARVMASEIVGQIFFARLLNVAEQIDDPMDLDQVLAWVSADIDDAARQADIFSADLIRASGSIALDLLRQARDVRTVYRPANR